MDSSGILAHIDTALGCLDSRWEQCDDYSNRINFRSMIHRLRVVRTFLLCSTMLANNNNAVPSPQPQKRETKQTKRRMRNVLGSLLGSIEDVVWIILDDPTPYGTLALPYIMESWDEKMDKWYTCLSDYLQQTSTVAVDTQLKAITESVLWNLEDYWSSKIATDQQSQKEMGEIDALGKNISFVRCFIRFGTLFSAENQEFQSLLTQIQPLAISAAHLVLSLFSNNKGVRQEPNDITSSLISAFLLKINHFNNPLLLERYTLALAGLKHSQRLHDSTLGLNYDPSMIIMEKFVASLLSTLREMQQLVYHQMMVSLKGKMTLHEGLRLLRTLLEKHPDKFDNGRARVIVAAAICDAGVIFFSLYQKDSVIEHAFRCFEYNIEAIRVEVLKEQVVKTPRFKYSETNVLGFLDFLLEDYLIDVKSSSTPSFVSKISEHLGFLKYFMGKLAELRNQEKSLHQDLWNISIGVVYKIELLIDQMVLGDIFDSLSISLQSITEDIMNIKADSLQIMNAEGTKEIFKVQQITWPSADKVPLISSNPAAGEVVGFENEKASIVNRLMKGFQKLQVVAIIGMPGLGKTTLATKVYSTPSISHYFHVTASCSISQVFDRRKVLLELINQIQPGESDSTLNEDDLSQQLWRSLRRRRYLIFIDDIWDTKAFDLLKGSLPDDFNKSRILLTSRHGDVIPEALLDDKPLLLRHLTVDECLELLRRKLFPAQEHWPSKLHEIGMEIAKYCKGLPLTIVIIAGILKSMEVEGWKDVLEALRSSIIPDECGSTIELSYNHLSDYLKPCFLLFGAFPEDHEFSVKKLIWLWISEGLVRKSESKSLEDVAADYLKNLIGRSLVMNVKGRATGGVKACRIHDLLHNFCVRKANEDYFLHTIEVRGNEEHMSIDELETPSFGEPDNMRRLCMYSETQHLLKCEFFFPRLRSLLFFNPIGSDLPSICRIFKLLRVLDMERVYLRDWPSEVGLLVQLRYLAIQVRRTIGPELGKLSNLETLIIHVVEGVVILPDTLWNLQKLRHLYSKRREYSINGSIELPFDDSERSCNLLELETVSSLCIRDLGVMEKQMKMFPNIRQMKGELMYGCVNDSKVLNFSFLSQLESLSLFIIDHEPELELIFPENLKKLTLRVDFSSWNKISSIAKLPNLEVLKLLEFSFYMETWHVEEGEFPELKFLKLRNANLVIWTAASDELFPNLEKLIVENCQSLEEVPNCLENVATLKVIEVIGCPVCVVSLVKSVEEFQKDMGNSALQFLERRTRG